jgi:hypothetical protein
MRVSACAIWLGLSAFVSGGAAAAEAAPDEQGPDIELLEYLGDLVDDHDRWVGPEDMKGVVDAQDATIVLDGDAAADAEQVR